MCFQTQIFVQEKRKSTKRCQENLEKSEWKENGEAQIEEKEASPLVGWTPTLVIIITIR